VSARSVVAALALLVGPGLSACSSPSPSPPRQPVGVETSVSTRYYPVRGTTTAAIFAGIDANHLVETNGQRAVGLTSAEWKLTSGDVDVRAVHLVVMLQRHETPDDLPADATEPAWNGYLVTVVCPRGAVLGRWVTPGAAELDPLQTASLN
jgi:hypothetical protein